MIFRNLHIKTPHGTLPAELTLPDHPRALIIATRLGEPPGAGTTSASLLRSGFAVLEIDLLTGLETHYRDSGQNAILLAERLLAAFDYCRFDGDTAALRTGIHATGLAVPAAVRATAQRDTYIRALVVRDGLIDHAGREYLEALETPLLALVSPDHPEIILACERAFSHLHCPHQLQTGPEEDEQNLVASWFERWLA